MGELGIIGPDERVELLDGELIAMPPIGPEHAYSVRSLNEYFVTRFAGRATVSVQLPVKLDGISEPQPDLMLTTLVDKRKKPAHPTPGETLLVVEVSLSSLAVDRGKKLRAYARRAIREYWIIDLVHDRIDVYREPRGQRYAKHRVVHRGEAIASLAFPGDAIQVEDILPPREARKSSPRR